MAWIHLREEVIRVEETGVGIPAAKARHGAMR